jgi:glutamyl-tRNA synthetase
MAITHVIRGDDHLSNTPKQILIHQVLGNILPRYAHLPQILGPDKKRLSKRHGATLVTEYREMGFKSEALVNYLALLGWSTSDSQQIFKLPDLIQKFSLDRVGRNPGIFDQKKLDWMNGLYIREMGTGDLLDKIIPLMQKHQLVSNPVTDEQKKLLGELVTLERERIKNFEEFPAYVDFFFKQEVVFNEEAKKQLEDETIKSLLLEIARKMEQSPDGHKETCEKIVRGLAEEKGIKAAILIHPLRAALSGRTVGSGLFDIMGLLGKAKCIERLHRALQI